MSNYDEVKKIFEKIGLLFSEWKNSEFTAATLKMEVKELSLSVSADNDELAEFVFSPNGAFLKIRPFEKGESNMHRYETHILRRLTAKNSKTEVQSHAGK